MITWAYVAGFFDGEGSLCRPSPSKITYRVQIAQSDKSVLHAIGEFISSYGVRVRYGKDPRKLVCNDRVKQTKPCYLLWIGGRKNVLYFIEKTLPYLLVKKVLAQDIRRMLVMFPDGRGFLYRDARGRILPRRECNR